MDVCCVHLFWLRRALVWQGGGEGCLHAVRFHHGVSDSDVRVLVARYRASHVEHVESCVDSVDLSGGRAKLSHQF